MSSYRINLLKLIDLAIGSPNPGSVNFNLLHKILYVLALRDTSGGLCWPTTETDEIELSRSGTLINQKLLDEALKDGGSTRLTVQRVTNRSENDEDNQHNCNPVCIRIAGSRIVMPSRGNSQHSIGQPERIESQMSAMSTMVSDLEERVEQISLKPSNACEKQLTELRSRIEGLEKAIEKPVLKQTMDGPLEIDEDELKLEMGKMWDSIQILTEKMNTFPRIDGTHGSPVQIDGIENGETVHHNSGEPLAPEIESSPADKPETDNIVPIDSHMAEIVHSIESQIHDLELKLQSMYEEIKSSNKPIDSIAVTNEAPESPQIADQFALIEQKFTTKIGQIEHLIKRLFQEKADDAAIESRIRQSVRLSFDISNRVSYIPLDELPFQRREDHSESLSTVKDQLEATQKELLTLREMIQSMTNQHNLLSVINKNSEKIKQLHVQLETFRKAHPIEPEKAAGTKLKPLMDLRCISCNRAVAMDRCDEIIPKPPLLSVTRVVKPNLLRELHEVHKSMEHHETVGETVGHMAHLENIYRSLGAAKIKYDKK
ncbi:uncharacterized protein LOC110676664 [Aedes aegypti]|uniref:DUF4795 domain-containing protein n=1 Tax=Aedes aegypti TaxID=7159 RepID=A0A6I8TT25_AEDAE|nr:uncharacterized protein LOC110676664 [Aedes aegypti]